MFAPLTRPPTMAEVAEVAAALSDLVARLDPDSVPAREAATVYGQFDRMVRAATAGRTLLARRVEESREWERHGHRNAAEHLAAATGSSLRDARTELETSKVLPSLPQVAGALRSGQVSADQGAVIADAARRDPSAAGGLVEAAGRSNLQELREQAGRVKAAADPDPDATHRRIHAERRCTRFTDTDGAFCLTVRGTPETGAVITGALDRLIDQRYRSGDADQRPTRDQMAYDALVEMARRATGAIATAPQGTTAASTTKRPNERFLGLLRIDLEALRRGRTEGDELCEIAGVGPVPVRIARQLLGEAVLKLVITKGVDVGNVTSLGRGPTAAMKVALAWSMPTCTVEGCSRTHTEYDHRIDFAHTRHTRLDELDPLCDGHHDLKTRKGWALVPGTGKRPMVPPDDPRHPDHHGPPGRDPVRRTDDHGPLDPRERRARLAQRVADTLERAVHPRSTPLPGFT